ncbi:HAMP domain-containing histidine kinase [Streptomyces sp. F63]|nr:HAMP domain-containing histidine kinase [Streptomyces sp. F63]
MPPPAAAPSPPSRSAPSPAPRAPGPAAAGPPPPGPGGDGAGDGPGSAPRAGRLRARFRGLRSRALSGRALSGRAPSGRFRFRTGLRWKLSAAIAAVGALVALALSLVVHNAARVSLLNGSRDIQDERVTFAQRIYESTGRLNFDAHIDDPDLPPELREAVRGGQRATYLEDTGDGAPEVWAAVPLAGGRVLSIHTRFEDRYAVLGDLDRALSIGSVSVIGGGCLLGVLVGGQLSRRLRQAATAAGRVAQGDTEVRVRAAISGRVRDETDDLARAVDAMADALQQRLEAERRVTADIAHELRTPVTGLVTAAELLPPGRPSELVRDRAQALRTLVEDVLEVARLDSATERAELQEVALGEFVARRVRVLAPEAVTEVVRDARVQTDPRRLERVLGNLLANAATHGRGPVRVTVEGRILRVRDHGPGFPPALLDEGPSRFRTGSADRAGRGHGLGLTIAAGQARVLGADLTFRNAPGGGAVAVLWLPGTAPTDTGGIPLVTVPGPRS